MHVVRVKLSSQALNNVVPVGSRRRGWLHPIDSMFQLVIVGGVGGIGGVVGVDGTVIVRVPEL